MKKWIAGLVVAGLAVGAGSIALAAENGKAEFPGVENFKQMLPFMKKMHPNLSEQELQDMFNACHGADKSGNMMNQQGHMINQSNNMMSGNMMKM
ncbi:hypothetical protein [Effusibacillus lacus]|uniref:FAD/FMN-containing dehydrogenase n=1 Tax=Effusibacillus lacus TaxID=1348429 RepID=A0A292YNW4_9BACL|nr:hypothetical protein [Effusibacillus lacus]TCS74969.1 hypothetical protein EDD64_11093 [Effusibacillus lacus]GAX91638.1 hypothetical protein EFBL_3328 [Effusibacillus lacus]